MRRTWPSYSDEFRVFLKSKNCGSLGSIRDKFSTQNLKRLSRCNCSTFQVSEKVVSQLSESFLKASMIAPFTNSERTFKHAWNREISNCSAHTARKINEVAKKLHYCAQTASGTALDFCFMSVRLLFHETESHNWVLSTFRWTGSIRNHNSEFWKKAAENALTIFAIEKDSNFARITRSCGPHFPSDHFLMKGSSELTIATFRPQTPWGSPIRLHSSLAPQK